MALDHYASLGVTRTSESVVIRAAYLALMRQYHPDANISSQADARVREINAAYDVLGNAVKRREYDRGLDWGAPSQDTNFGRRPPGVGPMAFGITILTVSALVWGTWAQQAPREASATAAAAATSRALGTKPSGAEMCLPAMAEEMVRRDLFQHVAGVRSVAQRDPKDLAEKLIIQAKSAPSLIDPTSDPIACELTITVKAPAGFSFSGGMSALVGTAHYFVGRLGPERDHIIEFLTDPRLLENAASIHKRATAPRLSSTQPQAAYSFAQRDFSPRSRSSPSVSATPGVPLTARRVSTQSVEQARLTPAEPACDELDSVASPICNDASLTALDGQLTAFERQSGFYADAAKRDQLKQSRLHFEMDRAQCRTKTCVRDTIVGRLTHVANIMSDKRGSNPSDGQGVSHP